MKKLVLAAFAAVLLPTLVFAQGTVAFTTSDFVNHRLLMESDLSAAPAGSTAQLFWSPDNSVAYVQIAANSVTVNGFLTAPVLGTTGAATAPGAAAWFYVAGQGGGGTGQTAHFQNPTGNPNSTPPGTPENLTGWTSPVLLSIPEPSTIALAGLGVGALLLFRRRK